MKRLIAMLSIFFVMMSFATAEIVYAKKFYKTQSSLIVRLECLMEIDPEHIDSIECIEAFDTLKTHWQKNKRFIMIMGNHNVAKYIDERLVSLEQLLTTNERSDAFVAIKTLKVYVASLLGEVLPRLQNLL